jgi:hypothetical protein
MTYFEHLHFGRKPGTARLSNRMNSVLRTIKDCITNRRLFPALTLIYSSIDVLGSFQNQDGYATQDSFRDWVTNYLFRVKPFPFNEYDLWGARCGIVHTMRYDSKHGATLKTIVYGFRGYDGDIQKITDPTLQVGVYVEDLYDALKTAFCQYLDYLEGSSDAIINTNLEKLPKYVDLIPLD